MKNANILVAELRKRLKVSENDVSDQELLDRTYGTFFRAVVELSIAFNDFVEAIFPIFKRNNHENINIRSNKKY